MISRLHGQPRGLPGTITAPEEKGLQEPSGNQGEQPGCRAHPRSLAPEPRLGHSLQHQLPETSRSFSSLPCSPRDPARLIQRTPGPQTPDWACALQPMLPGEDRPTAWPTPPPGGSTVHQAAPSHPPRALTDAGTQDSPPALRHEGRQEAAQAPGPTGGCNSPARPLPRTPVHCCSGSLLASPPSRPSWPLSRTPAVSC